MHCYYVSHLGGAYLHHGPFHIQVLPNLTSHSSDGRRGCSVQCIRQGNVIQLHLTLTTRNSHPLCKTTNNCGEEKQQHINTTDIRQIAEPTAPCAYQHYVTTTSLLSRDTSMAARSPQTSCFSSTTGAGAGAGAGSC